MKADIILSGNTLCEVEVERREGHYEVTLTRDGEAPRTLTLDYHEEHGVAALKVNGRAYSVELAGQEGRYAACLGQHRLEADLCSAEERLRRRIDTDSGQSKNTIEAHMPGTVLEVLVKAGDEIAVGGQIAVVEAMKMEDTLCAPCAATVEQVHVAEGDSIQEGQVIVTFREES